MMRTIAIGLAAATIAIGSSTLGASALQGHNRSGLSGPVSGAIKSHRFGRTYGYEEERGRDSIAGANRYEGTGRLTARERDRVKRIMREGFAELSPREREHLRGAVREHLAGLTPREREHLRGVVRERLAGLTPRERMYLREIIRERLAEFSPRERADISQIERGRAHRRGAYGRR